MLNLTGYPSNVFTSLASLLCLLAATVRANGQLVAYDGFNYTAGTLNADSGGGSIGWGGAWSGANSVKTGSLTFPDLLASGNKVETVGNGVGSFRTLSATYGGLGQTLFFSFTARVDPGTGSQPGATYAGVSLFNSTEQFFMGIPSSSTNWGEVSRPGSGPIADSTTSASSTTEFLVYELVYSLTGTVSESMFVNPTPGAALPAIPSAYLTNQPSFTFNQVRVQSGGTLDVDIDELRLGKTYPSVSPPIGASEPSGLMIAAALTLGCCGIALRRKMRIGIHAH